MRTIEIIIITLLSLRLLSGFKRNNRWLDWLSIVMFVAALLHLILEGYRWQMIPSYTSILILMTIDLFNLRRDVQNLKRPVWHTLLTFMGLMLLLVVIILPPTLLPVPEIYIADGPYPVGTTSFILVDHDREEIYSGKSGEPRQIVVQLWYPAVPEPDADYGPWVANTQVIAPALSEYLGFPAWFLDHLKYANGHAYPDAPIAEGDSPYPLLVFSHGWSGFRAQNTFQMVALASHGYVVAAPDHTYGAIAAVFPNGEVEYKNSMALPLGKGLPEDEFLSAARKLGTQWAGDLRFIVNSLQIMDQIGGNNSIKDRIDFTRIGAFGHSTGGGASLQYCALDSRCGAVLALDPYMDPITPEALSAGVNTALMGMFAEGNSDHSVDDKDYFRDLRTASSGETYQFEIRGTRHYDFTDLPAFSPLASTLGLKGPLNGNRALEIITNYTLGFFGKHLQGIDSEILERGVEGYPELKWIYP